MVSTHCQETYCRSAHFSALNVTTDKAPVHDRMTIWIKHLCCCTMLTSIGWYSHNSGHLFFHKNISAKKCSKHMKRTLPWVQIVCTAFLPHTPTEWEQVSGQQERRGDKTRRRRIKESKRSLKWCTVGCKKNPSAMGRQSFSVERWGDAWMDGAGERKERRLQGWRVRELRMNEHWFSECYLASVVISSSASSFLPTWWFESLVN